MKPLAEQLRPHTLDEFIGQSHLLAPGMPLRLALEKQQPHSMILWGPPGVGKTTLARLIADSAQLPFEALSAVLAGVKDIRDAVARAHLHQAQFATSTLVFVDEVHRFNKSQQDAFLPHVESGLFVFIGATTENPSFEVNSALLSRAALYVLQPLTETDLAQILSRALKIALPNLQLEEPAREMLIDAADGDGRQLLNYLQRAAQFAQAQENKVISASMLARVVGEKHRRFDKGGEAFYDQISALHKAVRGSNPDAALYWLCRMLDGGAEPKYLARRIIRMAVEDIGLADPRALTLSCEAAQVYDRLGSPEGELALAQAVIYLACAAKSNAVYQAYKQAQAFIQKDGSRPVPLHLRNAPTKLMQTLGYGHEYRYAHNEPNAYAAGEQYFPDGIQMQFYTPTDRGLEGKIADKLNHLKQLDQQYQQTIFPNKKPNQTKDS